MNYSATSYRVVHKRMDYMLIIDSLEKMKPYYNENTKTYEFLDNGKLINVFFTFSIDIKANITAMDITTENINAWDINARDIKAMDITAENIKSWDINAGDINARDINANNINSRDINAGDIKAWNIKAMDINANNINSSNINAWNIKAGDIKAWDITSRDINAGDINARDINAGDINAWDIKAENINAGDIFFYAICSAKRTLKCKTIKGIRKNTKYFCLDNEVEFIKANNNSLKELNP